MEYRELKNFGEYFTEKPSTRVVITGFASLPKDLGITAMPKVLASIRRKERYWKKVRFKSAEERGFTNQDFMGTMRYALTIYTAALEALGSERTSQVYWKYVRDNAIMISEEFFPAAEDFMRCEDPWEAVRQYFLEFFRAQEREGAMAFDVVQDTSSEFQVYVTDCVRECIWREAGYPELTPFTGELERVFFARLMGGMGGDFRRECRICEGDPVCDWHFYRYKSAQVP